MPFHEQEVRPFVVRECMCGSSEMFENVLKDIADTDWFWINFFLKNLTRGVKSGIISMLLQTKTAEKYVVFPRKSCKEVYVGVEKMP